MNRVFARIDLNKLVENLGKIQQKIVDKDKTSIMAVVKADAYGHGAIKVAEKLSEQGIECFGVACLKEAVELKNSGLKGDILILSEPSIIDFEQNMEQLIPEFIHTVYSREYIDFLAEVARKTGTPACPSGREVRVHLKVDTGMHRLGVNVDEVDDYIAYIGEAGLKLEGIFTHFCCADDPRNVINREQAEKFLDIQQKYADKGLLFHCENSDAINNFRDLQFDMVRSGISLYKGVMTVTSYVNLVKDLKKGDSVSYGATYTAEKDMKIAVVSAGYADGIRRDLSNKGEVIIGSRSPAGRTGRFSIVGRICMDMFMVDVTGSDIRRGDEVVIIGNQGEAGITAEDVADQLGTIDYEILCGISKRVERIY